MDSTIVLVHGAFAESASWDRVIDPLRRAGHRVIAAANRLDNPRRLTPGQVLVIPALREHDTGRR